MRKSILWLLLLPLFTAAQNLPAGRQGLPSIEEKTNGQKKYEGYFPFYWDENTGKLWLEVDKLDTEFLYVVSLPSGLGSNDIGLDRGLLGEDRVVKFSKVGRKIQLSAGQLNRLLHKQQYGVLRLKQKAMVNILLMQPIFSCVMP